MSHNICFTTCEPPYCESDYNFQLQRLVLHLHTRIRPISALVRQANTEAYCRFIKRFTEKHPIYSIVLFLPRVFFTVRQSFTLFDARL
jgi:hypothetical protein